MKQFILFLYCFSLLACTPTLPLENLKTASAKDFITPFEKDNNTTATYQEGIDFYKKLETNFSQFKLIESGQTDVGKPLHVGVLSKDGDFNSTSIRAKNKRILLINNAIHAGEPTGVDASMMLIRDLLTKKELQTYLDDLVIVVVPFYNIGGVLNRNSHTRTNQNGPAAYGFRGNARNFDLNRDFIKCDTKNAKSFNQLFHVWQPDVFIDNHTSNGADYQYTMTLIATQHNKLNPNLADFMQQKMLPILYDGMKKSGWEMTPYVYARNTPEDGIAGFLDLPRYSSGYAALFNTLSFITEAHMLKPYSDRVRATYAFMDNMIRFMNKNHEAIKTARSTANEATRSQEKFDVNWTLDMENKEMITFKGYEAKYKPSAISGKERLYYDRNQPYEKEIPFLNNYKATTTIQKPYAYIIPQSYSEIIERLKWNNVEVGRLAEDLKIEGEVYYIKDYKTGNRPYEGHYLHSAVEVVTETQTTQFYKGDYVIVVEQDQNRYIVETLEPQSADAFFAWNFFDGILQQKEYFSPYVFEDLAAKYLEEDADLKKKLEEKKARDPKFTESAYAQLDFIYKNSPHYEKTHNRYPIVRVVEARKFPYQ